MRREAQEGTYGPGGTLQDLSYTYDAVGNIASITDAGETTYFTYDALDRLTEASGPYSQSYSYDAIGNITTFDGVTYGYGQVSGIAPGAKPHAVTHVGGVETYGYDANGNMINHDGDSLTYDAENRLKSVTPAGGETITFTYDGDGRRVLRDTTNETIAYIGPHYEARFTKTNKPEDLDDDCRITVIDIMQVAAQWGTADPLADVNDDGTVDVNDVQQVSRPVAGDVPRAGRHHQVLLPG